MEKINCIVIVNLLIFAAEDSTNLLTQIALKDLTFVSKSINFSPPLQIAWMRVSYAIYEGLQSQTKSRIIVFTSLNTISGVWITLATYSN